MLSFLHTTLETLYLRFTGVLKSILNMAFKNRRWNCWRLDRD